MATTNRSQRFITLGRTLQQDSADYTSVVDSVQHASRRGNLIFFIVTVILFVLLFCVCCGPLRHIKRRWRSGRPWWGGAWREGERMDGGAGGNAVPVVSAVVVPTRAMHREQRRRQEEIRLHAIRRRRLQELGGLQDGGTAARVRGSNVERAERNDSATMLSSEDAEGRRRALIRHFETRGLRKVSGGVPGKEHRVSTAAGRQTPAVVSDFCLHFMVSSFQLFGEVTFTGFLICCCFSFRIQGVGDGGLFGNL